MISGQIHIECNILYDYVGRIELCTRWWFSIWTSYTRSSVQWIYTHHFSWNCTVRARIDDKNCISAQFSSYAFDGFISDSGGKMQRIQVLSCACLHRFRFLAVGGTATDFEKVFHVVEVSSILNSLGSPWIRDTQSIFEGCP